MTDRSNPTRADDAAWTRRTTLAGVLSLAVLLVSCGEHASSEPIALPPASASPVDPARPAAPRLEAAVDPSAAPAASPSPPSDEAAAPSVAPPAGDVAAPTVLASPEDELDEAEELPEPEMGAFEDIEDPSDVELGDLPPLEPELRAAARVGDSPWLADAETAASAGLVDPTGDDEGSSVFAIDAILDHHARTYVLFRAPGGLPEYATLAARERHHGAAPMRFALWLARLERRTDADGIEQVRRVAAVRLYDLALASADAEYASCTVASELRARDLDGDGEVELTVVAAAAAEPDAEEHCGAVAFLVGGDDLNVQARFTREHRAEHTGADGDRLLTDDTTWIVRDANGDGRADLHVVERFAYREDFEGDYVGEDYPSAPGSHVRESGRREVDCPYDLATDAWICPPVSGVVLGARLFVPPADLASGAATAFDGPPWANPPTE